MSGTRAVLIPRYLQHFRCIGTDCEDNCCIGWQVDIDQATYRKYQQVRDLELKGKLNQCMKRNRSNPHEMNYGKVIINADGECPFLNEMHLCSIQQKMGEAYLSDICTTYPRVANQVNGILEKAAAMSCPEAARLALLNPDVMEFDEIHEPMTTRNMIRRRIDTLHPRMIDRPERFFWDLRIFTIDVLQNREYELSERLMILGIFYQQLQQRLENGGVHDIPVLIDTFTSLIKAGDIKELLAGIPTQVEIQMELLKELTDVRVAKGVRSQRYWECFTQFLSGLQYTQDATVEDVADRYRRAEKDYYRPFITERQYLLEHYLVNYVFESCFPCPGSVNIFNNYVMLVVHYALVKMHCIGMAAFHKGLNEELYIKLIQSFAKTMEHNHAFLQRVLELLENNGYTTMAYMAILIKN